jgi:hypothetical protein
MVKCKDYYASTVGQNKLKALNSFTITGGHLGWKLNIIGSPGQEFPVAGYIKRNGENCYLMKPEENAGYALIVNPSGQFTGHAWNIGVGVEAAYTFMIDPPSSRFKQVLSEQVDASAGYVNYELIYSGKTSQSLNLLYREYTPEDLARPAFYQSLSYDADSKIIRFKKLKIEIGEANNEKITFAVLED